MSGGSFNYLCMVLDVHGTEELFRREVDLAEMAYTLHQISGTSAAWRDTKQVIERLASIRRELDAIVKPLEPVWKAVEWERSGDWGMDRVVELISVYAVEHGSSIKLIDSGE